MLFAALAFVSFLLWQAWQQDYESKPPIEIANTTDVPAATGAATSNGDVPKAPTQNATAPPTTDNAPVADSPSCTCERTCWISASA